MSGLKMTAIAGSLLLATLILASANRTANSRTVSLQEPTKTHQEQQKQSPDGPKQRQQQKEKQKPMNNDKMQFGNFSVSLAVKDLKASKAFYEKLDFQQVGGQMEHNYVIMQNGTSTIGLFQGMFEDNLMTFNPGWDRKAEALKEFQDVRDLQATLKERGIKPVTEADAKSSGPASFVIVDPDGNAILVDQHVPKPE